MPRRHVAFKKVQDRSKEYSDPLIGRFINIIMKQGKKALAERIFFSAMDKVKEKTGNDPLEVFKQAIEQVKPSLEVKSRRVGGSTYQIPVEVHPKRRLALAVRWIIESARKRNERGFSGKLAGELMDAYNNTGVACKKKEDTHKMAEANKAFSHYKW